MEKIKVMEEVLVPSFKILGPPTKEELKMREEIKEMLLKASQKELQDDIWFENRVFTTLLEKFVEYHKGEMQ